MKETAGIGPAAAETLEHGSDDAKTCQHCGRVFTRSEFRRRLTDEEWQKRRFCGRSCYLEELQSHAHARERICARQGCDNRFIPSPRQLRNGYGKFCSRECDHKAHRIHPEVEERECARPGCSNRFTPTSSNVAYGWGTYCSKRCSALSTGAHEKRTGRMVECSNCGLEFWRYECELNVELNFCTQSCWNRYRWDNGIALPPDDLVSLAPGIVSGRVRQLWLGRWGGRQSGHLGGRPRAEVTEAQRAEIQKLAAAGWGRRAIASRLLMSEKAVRHVLDEQRHE